jgi:4a-hydroxytetrahydrobiopterin dehydratase
MDWLRKKCLPCEGGTPKLEGDKIREWLGTIPGWIERDQRLHKDYRFQDFRAAMGFVNAMADLAEAEGHHPDFRVHDWNQVEVTLWTHAVGGLSDNDFILAAKIDALPSRSQSAAR